VKIVIDTPDSQSNRRWMKQYKDRAIKTGPNRIVDGELRG